MKSLHHITVSPATLPIICTYLFAGKVLRCSLTVCVIARNTQELIVEKLISNSNFVTLFLPQIFILFISPSHPSPLATQPLLPYDRFCKYLSTFVDYE